MSEAGDDAFLWRVEEACANAHPSPRELLLDGWLLRAAGGRARRTNSVNPLRFGPRDPMQIAAEAERLYAGLHQDCLFRVPGLAPGLDAALEGDGYAREGETCTLYKDLSGPAPETSDGTDLSERPDAAWLDAWRHLNAPSDPVAAAYQATLAALVVPAAFACRRVAGEPVALAYAALDRGVLVFESVVTHPRHRRQGHGGQVLGRLELWARSRGANGMALQVQADNAAGRALYRAAGFERELYRYHYRRKPLAAADRTR